MPRLTLVALLAAAALGVTACAADEPAAPTREQTVTEAPEGTEGEEEGGDGGVTAETIVVTAEDFSLDGIPATLPRGSVRIDFENAGRAPHDLVIEELGDRRVIPVTEPGRTASGTVTLGPGTYTFYCSVGDHRDRGMEATVTVD
ncbi:cupredoxin domain-containing protein [Nocardiopsis sp. NPDC049922]|uniref:cupredoxin domain-containing protein n=1 Tax=Nocardiopsis sp. NPDC049922 TaxID=3155157 RepID=UPI0033CD5E72